MLLFKLPLFKTVAADRNCGIILTESFLLERPPCSAPQRGLLALASWGSPPSPRTDFPRQSVSGQRQLLPSSQQGQKETRVYYSARGLHTWRYLWYRLLLASEWPNVILQRRTIGFSLQAPYVKSTASKNPQKTKPWEKKREMPLVD